MLGRSWGFTVIMEESRRCKAAEYLEDRWRGGDVHVLHSTGGCPGAGSPSPAPHLVVGGMAMGFCTARATLSPFWKTAS